MSLTKEQFNELRTAGHSGKGLTYTEPVRRDRTLTTEQVEEILAAGAAWITEAQLSSLAAELLALRKRAEELERATEFVTRWAWRERTNGPLTDAERLSAIKFHPAIKPALPTPKEPS